MKIKSAMLTFLILLIIFMVSATFFAIRLEPGIIPDEPEHFAISKQFATSWGIPEDSPETDQFGPLGRRPILYYWINGRVINGLSFFIPAPKELDILVTLRLLSVFYATLTVIFSYLLSREVLKNPGWQLLVVFLLTNTLMFVFLSGGLNYDTLVNLFCFAGLYFLVRVFNRKDFLSNSLSWLIFISAGALVKFTVLPLAVGMGIAWVSYVVTNRKSIFPLKLFSWSTSALWLLFLALILANLALYGINLLQYSALEPACVQVLTAEQCDQTINVIRNQRFALPEKLTLIDVTRSGYADPIEWFLDFWIGDMIKTIFGILGHKTYFPYAAISFYRLWLAWIIFLAIKYWKTPTFTIGGLLTLSIFYVLVVMQTNYNSELNTGFKHIAIQGRYLFPVIGVFYLLVVYFISNAPNNFLRRLTIYMTLLLFLWNQWFSPLSVLLIPSSSLPQSSVLFPYDGVPVESALGEVSGAVIASQDFVSECKGTINQVYLAMRVYHRSASQPVLVEIIDQMEMRVVAQNSTLSAEITDNAWQTFEIPPIADSLGKAYRIQISTSASIATPTVVLSGSILDTYPEGTAIFNGKTLQNDLSFKYQCLQPAFADWFND